MVDNTKLVNLPQQCERLKHGTNNINHVLAEVHIIFEYMYTTHTHAQHIMCHVLQYRGY